MLHLIQSVAGEISYYCGPFGMSARSKAYGSLRVGVTEKVVRIAIHSMWNRPSYPLLFVFLAIEILVAEPTMCFAR